MVLGSDTDMVAKGDLVYRTGPSSAPRCSSIGMRACSPCQTMSMVLGAHCVVGS